MKFFNKTTKEIYHFDSYQVQHELCQDKITDPNFVVIPDNFDPNFDTFNPSTSKVTTNTALVLQVAKDSKIRLAVEAYQLANESPITYKTVQYQTDVDSMSSLSAKVNAISAGWVVPKTFKWKALDNTLQGFKAADIKALYLAIDLRNQTNWLDYQTLKTKISAAKTATALNKIVV